jgi:superfamily II DNA/RNA helicase
VVGKLHQLSAGLVTGGRKEFEGEQERIVKMNILVATPGRLLQVTFFHTLSVFFVVERAVAV